MRISDWSSDVCSSDLEQDVQVARVLVADQRTEPLVDQLVQRVLGKTFPRLRRAQDVAAFERVAQPLTVLVRKPLVDQRADQMQEIGRASWRERVWQYV